MPDALPSRLGHRSECRFRPSDWPCHRSSFGFLLLLQRLDFTALMFDFVLLMRNLRARLLLCLLVLLQFVPDEVAASATHPGADQRAGNRMADGGSDNGAGTTTEQRAYAGRLLRRAELLPITSARGQRDDQRDCPDPTVIHAILPWIFRRVPTPNLLSLLLLLHLLDLLTLILEFLLLLLQLALRLLVLHLLVLHLVADQVAAGRA